ncbi:MAG: glycosyltransferase [Planctomycetes bacterium]|nr:glycosyltransferase [Planctomycetota bacterium]
MVVTTLDVGGAEKHLLLLTQGLFERGVHVDVAYLKGNGTLVSAFERLGARVTKIAFEGNGQLFGAIRGLAAAIRAGHYDVVHTHLLKADVLGAAACALARHACLVASKHNEEQVLKKASVGFVHGFVSRRARRVIALSDYVLEFVATAGRCPRDRLRRVYYGLDPQRFEHGDADAVRRELGLSATTHVALCAARFHPQKDHATLFRAARRLRDAGLDFRLLLAGDDPFYGLRPGFERLARELGVADRILFLGVRHDIPNLLAAADLFVLPSLYEGLGLVFLEAMSASRPVISTAATAIPEVVAHDETGLLVPVGDDEALAAAWLRLARSSELRARFGAAGRQRVERSFLLPRMVDETLAVYGEAMSKPR